MLIGQELYGVRPMKVFSCFRAENYWLSAMVIVMCGMFSFHPVFVRAENAARHFSGVVVDSKGQPLDKAVVRLQGTSLSTVTDTSGRFRLHAGDAVASKYVTAWKQGFFNGGQAVATEGTEYRISLNPVPVEDNTRYGWLPSSHDQSAKPTDDTLKSKSCQECHTLLTEQWRKSTHGTSAVNPLFLAFFSGTDKQGKKGAGPGYKTDFPNSSGNCSTCHVPLLALNNPFNSDPRDAGEGAREGVTCDLCHKIDAVRIDSSGGYPGILSYKFNRPTGGHQLFYGPYQDVFPGDDSYHPLYKESRYCAPCHNGKFWDVEMYSEYREWAESAYAARGVHCQDCHMAPDGIMTRFALENEGGVERGPETIPSHLFLGSGDRAFMAEAVDLNVRTELHGDVLNVIVAVRNVKAGHHYPTGNPMRNMILLVEATDGAGRGLSLIDGARVPLWGGVGEVKERNYAGLPGKGFAKVLRDAIPYPDSQRGRHFRPEYPAPHWRPALVESDSRIPANGSDVSTYRFRVPSGMNAPIQVTSRLIYRRAYKSWLDEKRFAMDEMEIARKGLSVGRGL
jgi:hypothetical protein